MLFHCIYLHPFQTQLNIDNGVWNIALDICCENAVMRLNPEAIDGDVERQQIIAGIKGKVKMFIPELVYNELMQNQSNYNFFDLTALFHMDDHVWLNPPQGGKGNDEDEDNPYQNPNAQSQQGDGDDDQNQQNQQGDGNGNGEDGRMKTSRAEMETVIITIKTEITRTDRISRTARETIIRIRGKSGAMSQGRLPQTCLLSIKAMAPVT